MALDENMIIPFLFVVAVFQTVDFNDDRWNLKSFSEKVEDNLCQTI